MRIFGIGTDIVNVKRMEKSFRKNKSFKKRIFSQTSEIEATTQW